MTTERYYYQLVTDIKTHLVEKNIENKFYIDGNFIHHITPP